MLVEYIYCSCPSIFYVVHVLALALLKYSSTAKSVHVLHDQSIQVSAVESVELCREVMPQLKEVSTLIRQSSLSFFSVASDCIWTQLLAQGTF